MCSRSDTNVPTSRRSTRATTTTVSSGLDLDDIWFICVGCGNSTNSAWGRKPGYPSNSCLDCGRKWMKKSSAAEDATTMVDNTNDREASTQSTIEVVPPASEENERPGRPAANAFNHSHIRNDPATSIQRLQKLNKDATAIQQEQLSLINSISGTTEQLLENEKQHSAQTASLQEENNRLHRENQTLREECDGLVAKGEKLEAKLREFEKARRLLLRIGNGDDEEE